MDLPWRRREIRKLHIRKAAQVGASEAIRNIIGFMAHMEPDPMLLVLPDEKTGKRVMGKRILPLFEDTPCLQALRTQKDSDQQLTQVLLANGFNLQLGWTGSAATMAADPARIAIIDETDKSKEWTGKESGPVELVDVRTTTYENSLIITLSTPTTREGPITQLSENAQVKLSFYCPCPHCGHAQVQAFGNVRYPKLGMDKPAALTWITDEAWSLLFKEENKSRRAALVETWRAAWFECERCGGVIVDHQRPRMFLAGFWGTDDQGYRLYIDGHEEGRWPMGSEVAVHIPATISLAAKHKFFRIAAEWIRCEGDPKRTQGFKNSWLGEAFQVLTHKTQPDRIRQKAVGAAKPLIVPSWAQVLIASADVQGLDPSTGYFYYVIRAWSYGYRSQLIDYGIVNTFEELREKCLDRVFSVEGGKELVQTRMFLIDSGNRSNEVYQFALSDPERIKPTKGSSTRLSWPVQKKQQSSSGVILWHIDTEQTKDLLNRLIHDADPALWAVNDAINDDYCQQLASEEKAVNPKTKRPEWKPKTEHTPNHLLDCEQQQCAAAWDYGCGMAEPVAPPEEPPEPTPVDKPEPFATRNLLPEGQWRSM